MAEFTAEDSARRAYWSSQLDAAHRFMQQAMSYPVAECGEKMVSLKDAANAAGLEVQYSDRKHALGLERLFFLREGQIDGFIGAAREMNRRGWIMKVEDGFRTVDMQKFLARHPAVFDSILTSLIWELGGKTPEPEFFLRRSMTLVALMPKVGTHMSGSAIDISVFHRDNPELEVDRGGPYLEMSARTPMLSPYVSDTARSNRQEITVLMRRHGFVEYPFEFWHYNSGDACAAILLHTEGPAKYGAVFWNGPGSDTVTPIPNPCDPLNSEEEIRAEIEASLSRLRNRRE